MARGGRRHHLCGHLLLGQHYSPSAHCTHLRTI
jgi:hypothetical protein